jgi:hypothetical protein
MDQMPSTFWTPYGAVGTPLLTRTFVLTANELAGYPPATVRASDGFAIDSKIDDGSPLTGSVIAIGNAYSQGNPQAKQPTAGINGNGYTNQNIYSLTS